MSTGTNPHSRGRAAWLWLPLVSLSALAAAAGCGKADDDGGGASGGTPGEMTGGQGGAPGETAGGTSSGASSGGEGGVGSGTGGVGPDGSFDFALDGDPILSGFVRLTHSQWQNSVRDLFEVSFLPDSLAPFAPDVRDGTFSNNEKSLFVGDPAWEDHQRGAVEVAAFIAGDADRLERLGGVEDPRAFIQKLGKRAFRRPLTEAEVTRFEGLWQAGATETDYYSLGDAGADGARLFLEGLLQSPFFLYRVELSPPGTRLTGLELATKLSLLLLDTAPSDELLEAAEAGELDTSEGIATIAGDMLASASGRATLVRFHRELYQVERYESIVKDTALFPGYSSGFNSSVAEADQRLLEALYESEAGLRGVLTTPLAFVDANTANYYGQTAPASGFAEVALEGRPGLVTRLGFLASRATPRETSPVQRGQFLLSRTLCVKLEPPGGVVPVLPTPPEPSETGRQWLTKATGTAPCATCHNYINPLGFAFENFDAIGQLRSSDNGQPVDTSGEFPLAGGSATFANADELMRALAEERLTHECYSAHMAEYVLARDLRAEDEAAVLESASASFEGDASMRELVLGFVQSPLFTNAPAL